MSGNVRETAWQWISRRGLRERKKQVKEWRNKMRLPNPFLQCSSSNVHGGQLELGNVDPVKNGSNLTLSLEHLVNY